MTFACLRNFRSYDGKGEIHTFTNAIECFDFMTNEEGKKKNVTIHMEFAQRVKLCNWINGAMCPLEGTTCTPSMIGITWTGLHA